MDMLCVPSHMAATKQPRMVFDFKSNLNLRCRARPPHRSVRLSLTGWPDANPGTGGVGLRNRPRGRVGPFRGQAPRPRGLSLPRVFPVAGTVVGVVLYTGRELRSVMNASSPRSKVRVWVPGRVSSSGLSGRAYFGDRHWWDEGLDLKPGTPNSTVAYLQAYYLFMYVHVCRCASVDI